MSKLLSLSISMLFFIGLTACSSAGQNSFTGEIHIIQDEQLKVDCSDEVENEGTLKGYLCNVKINGETELKSENDESMSVEELEKGQTVKVIMEGQKSITNDKEDREINAKEIVLVN